MHPQHPTTELNPNKPYKGSISLSTKDLRNNTVARYTKSPSGPDSLPSSAPHQGPNSIENILAEFFCLKNSLWLNFEAGTCLKYQFFEHFLCVRKLKWFFPSQTFFYWIAPSEARPGAADDGRLREEATSANGSWSQIGWQQHCSWSQNDDDGWQRSKWRPEGTALAALQPSASIATDHRGHRRELVFAEQGCQIRCDHFLKSLCNSTPKAKPCEQTHNWLRFISIAC